MPSVRRRLAFVNHLRLDLPTGDVPLRGGSISIWHFEIARRLAKEFDVVVYSPRYDAEGGQVERFEDVDYVSVSTRFDDRMARLAGWGRRLCGALASPRRPFFASRRCLGRFARVVAEDIRSRRCDLAYVSNYSQLVPAIRKRNPEIRTGLHMQCEWLTQIDPRIVEPRLRLCDRIGGCSRFISEGVARRFPDHAERCFPLWNGVDLGLFHPAEGKGSGLDTPHLLFVGRLSPEKGVHDLLAAFPLVAERVPGVRLTLVGGKSPAPMEYIVAIEDDPIVRGLARFYADGPDSYETSLRRSIPRDLVDRVVFRDDLPQARLPEAYREADIVVLPSAWNEPFGMPLAEAMACGIPVVATRGGGIPEFVEEGRSGLLVERGDPAALSRAIATLLERPDMRLAFGKAGRQRVERDLDWEKVAGRLGEKFEEALGRGEVGRRG